MSLISAGRYSSVSRLSFGALENHPFNGDGLRTFKRCYDCPSEWPWYRHPSRYLLNLSLRERVLFFWLSTSKAIIWSSVSSAHFVDFSMLMRSRTPVCRSEEVFLAPIVFGTLWPRYLDVCQQPRAWSGELEYQRARAKEKGRPSRVPVANHMMWKSVTKNLRTRFT